MTATTPSLSERNGADGSADDGGRRGGRGVTLAVSFDGIHAVCLGKELALLLVLMGIVMAINDEADAIGAELVYGGLWGEHGSPQEGRRLDLLALATTYGNREAALASVWAYATTPPVRPISFLLCGVRISALTSGLSRFQYFSPSSASCCAGCCISGESSAWSMERLARL